MASDDVQAARTKRLLAVIGFIVGLTALVAWVNRPGTIAGPGSAIQLDDFAFRIEGTSRLDTSIPGAFVVRLRVENRARRVDFRFRPETAKLIDADGRLLAPIEGSRDPAGSPIPCGCDAPMPAGTECVASLTYRLPDGYRPERLVIRGDWIGAILDAIFCGKPSLALP